MRILLLFVVSFIILACNSQPQKQTDSTSTSAEAVELESPEITIQVEGMEAGLAYLIGTFSDQQYRIDSAAVEASGRMVFKREEPYPAGLYYAYFPDQTAIQLMTDVDQTFSIKTKKGNLIEAAEVTGSLENELLYHNLKFESNFQPRVNGVNQRMQALPQTDPTYLALKAEQDQLVAERKAHLKDIFDKNPDAFFTQYKRSGQNPDLVDVRLADGSVDQQKQIYFYRTQFWDNVDFNDERLLYTPIVVNKLKRYMTELTAQNPDSVIKSASFLIDKVLDKQAYYKFFVNWIGVKYEPTKTALMDGEAIYVYMVQNYITPERAFWATEREVQSLQERAKEMAGSLIGHKGLEVQAADPTGKTRSTTEITMPYLVIFIFNPTCDHCIEETPHLVKFYQERKAKDVGIFTIALETDNEEWTNFIDHYGLNDFINVFDPTYGAIYAKYYVDNTPEIYVLNPDRIIIGKNLKPGQIAEIIERDKNR